MRGDDQISHTSGMRAMLPAIVFALATLGVVFAVLHPQQAAGEVGLVFPPWASEAEIHAAIVAAGGQIVAPSRLPNVVVAYAPDPAFHDAVRAQGAWFAIAATGLCAPPDRTQTGGPSV